MKDKIIEKIINEEQERQNNHIELIPSENFVSNDVLKATGSILTNKYAEGYPGKRYYDGCKYIDQIENIARDRLKELFNVKYANVQPHSGSQANAAVYAALLKPGDKILGMSLNSGGHLTHGYKISFSGTFYKSCTYDVNEDGIIDYEKVLKVARECNPDIIVCGYSAYSRTIDFKKFSEIAKEVNAYLLADIAHIAGLVSAGEHPSPVGYVDVITSTTHKTLRGARGGIIMTNDEVIAKQIDRAIFPGLQGGPLMHSIAGKAIAFGEALKPEFKEYAKQIIKNSIAFADEFIKLGANIVSGGTDNHLFTINVKDTYNISGKEASDILQKNNITVNKNTVPNDKLSPMVTSGIRVGTPAMTTKGFKIEEFKTLANLIHQLLSNQKKDILEDIKKLIYK